VLNGQIEMVVSPVNQVFKKQRVFFSVNASQCDKLLYYYLLITLNYLINSNKSFKPFKDLFT